MDAIAQTTRKVRQTIDRYRMIDPEDRIVVAVSGGPDSVCLLDVLFRMKEDHNLRLVVAHLEHGLRNREDESETRFVRDLARSMTLPLETKKASLAADGLPGSTEERAREVRYDFLNRVKEKHRAGKIATGHTLNDQAETFLMRLLRGSGLAGLAGIPPCRSGGMIRPLIEVGRAEILAYLRQRGLTYVMDRSNRDIRFFRNEIRHRLLPRLLRCQPRLLDHLDGLTASFREENAFFEKMAADWTSKVAHNEGEGYISIPLASLTDLEPALAPYAVRHLIKRSAQGLRRIDRAHIRAVFDLAVGEKPQGQIHLPGGLTVHKNYQDLVFSTGQRTEPAPFQSVMDEPGECFIDNIGRTVRVRRQPCRGIPPHPDSPWTAHVDADAAPFPLTIRSFRPGDRFRPLGMKGRKKVKDFFMDLKIPSRSRPAIPILLSALRPVWICGYRIDDRVKITRQTRRMLVITITPP